MARQLALSFRVQFYLWKRWLTQSGVAVNESGSTGFVGQTTWRLLLLLILSVMPVVC
jgi:hypothetical protein